jgi:hypothetical protein
MRTSLRDAVAAVFHQYPGEWLHWSRFADAGGAMAWRTRISDCRRELGMSIENRVDRYESGKAESYYRWLPERLF